MVIRVFWLSILSPVLLLLCLLVLDNWFGNVASVTSGLFESRRRDSNHPWPVTGISGTTSKEMVPFSRNTNLKRAVYRNRRYMLLSSP